MRVAILDDEPAELRRVEQTLEQMAEAGEQPWSLHSFERGEDLLRQLRRETFDLLILDWQLPDLTGLALLRWTREHMEAPPAAIMLTSRDGESDIVQALNAGADDYVSKPFRPNELKARVAAVLRRHSQPRSAATEVLSFFAYRRAFLGLSLNEGAAAALILLLIVLAMTIVYFVLLERRR